MWLQSVFGTSVSYSLICDVIRPKQCSQGTTHRTSETSSQNQPLPLRVVRLRCFVTAMERREAGSTSALGMGFKVFYTWQNNRHIDRTFAVIVFTTGWKQFKCSAMEDGTKVQDIPKWNDWLIFVSAWARNTERSSKSWSWTVAEALTVLTTVSTNDRSRKMVISFGNGIRKQRHFTGLRFPDFSQHSSYFCNS